MMAERPQFTATISLGNALQIAILLVGLGVGWMTIKAQGEANSSALATAAQDRSNMEIRIRALENQSARADERFTSILGYLSRIDTRLERIEGRSE